MAGASGSTSRAEHGSVDSRMALVLPALASLLVLAYSLHLFGGISPLGDDASSHITTISTLASRIAAGDGWWSTEYNIGFPMVLYYQPLPHIASALFCLLIGGPERAILTYKILITLLVALQPWAIYLGMRRIGLPRLHAACAGALAPLVMNSLLFGYTTFASLKVGLYTQAWGNLALPLAVGELVAMIKGRGRFATAIAACAFTASTHMFYAIVLVPPIAVLAVVLPLSSRGDRSIRDAARNVLSGTGRLFAVGVATFAILSAWMIPLARTQSYFGGWPFSTNQPAHGWGWEIAIRHIYEFTLLDGPNFVTLSILPRLRGAEVDGFPGALPILTILAFAGLLLARRRLPDAAATTTLVVLCAWSFLGLVGSEGLGWVFNLYPLHKTVQLFRYGAVAQFAFLCAAGVGLGAVATSLGRSFAERVNVPPAALHVAIALVILAGPATRGAGQLKTGFRTLEDDNDYAAAEAEYAELVGWLREMPSDGRMLVGPKTETRKHFHGGLLAFLAQRPAGQSYGVGLHDSLHFYTLEFYNVQQPNALALADLYDFRYAVSRPDHAMRGLDEHREVLHENERYVVSSLEVSGESVVLMREAERIEGTPRGARVAIREWLNGNGPALQQTVVLEVTDDRDRENLVEAPIDVPGVRSFADATPPVGVVLASNARGATANATVTLEEPALVVFKVGYHPFWSATLDGAATEVLFAFPGFAAVAAGPGTHEVEIRFAWPRSSRVLVWLGPFVLLGAAFWDWRSRRHANVDTIGTTARRV